MSEEKWYKRDDVEYWKKEYLELSKQLEEKEIVLDKIKEYIKENNHQEPWKSVQGDYILELLEEIE